MGVVKRQLLVIPRQPLQMVYLLNGCPLQSTSRVFLPLMIRIRRIRRMEPENSRRRNYEFRQWVIQPEGLEVPRTLIQ
jgi:hypothetical protein